MEALVVGMQHQQRLLTCSLLLLKWQQAVRVHYELRTLHCEPVQLKQAIHLNSANHQVLAQAAARLLCRQKSNVLALADMQCLMTNSYRAPRRHCPQGQCSLFPISMSEADARLLRRFMHRLHKHSYGLCR